MQLVELLPGLQNRQRGISGLWRGQYLVRIVGDGGDFHLQPLQGPKPEMKGKQGYNRAKQDRQPENQPYCLSFYQQF